jgi:hypothetical protein
MAILPLVMTDQGLQPRAPLDIRNEMVARVAFTNPGYTDNLPGSLVEDIMSTGTAAVVESDQFLVDLVNSISPRMANPFMLRQLGLTYDVYPKDATNTSVYVVFVGPPGFVVVKGFTVSDGNYHYVCQSGGVIGASGQSMPIFAVATITGAWAVPAGSVRVLDTSVPAVIMNAGFGVINPADGIPASAGEAIEDYRDRVQTAGLAGSSGGSRYFKTLVWPVPGVIKRLVSLRQDKPSGRYMALVGGGDAYQVAYAIYEALFWVVGLTVPTIAISDIAIANPAVITTFDNHNLSDGMVETIDGVEGTGRLVDPDLGINGKSFPVTVIDPKTFSVPFDPTPTGSTYVIGGVVTPNPIVEEVTLNDWPDHYAIQYVIPPAQEVAITVVWKTDSPNYINPAAVATAAQQPLLDYVNGIPAGPNPLSLYELENTFLDACDPTLPRETIISLVFNVSIHGVGVLPEEGTGVIYGDVNSYFALALADLTILEALEGIY